MPVFDFNSAPEDKKEVQCTYTTFCSNEDHATPECPILVLDNQNRKWNHHSCGVFTNQNKQTAFEFDEKDGTCSADILKVDARFVSLLKWLEKITLTYVFPEKISRMVMPFTESVRSHLEAEQNYLLRTASFSL